MKGNGKKTDKMEMVLRHGLTVHDMKVNTDKVKSMVKVTLFGQMDLDTMENSLTTTFREQEFMSGLMADDSKGLGKTTKWTEKEFLTGQIKGGMQENIKTIKKKATVTSLGQTDDNIKAVGSMENSMEKEYTSHQQEKSEKDFGKMESEQNG